MSTDRIPRDEVFYCAHPKVSVQDPPIYHIFFITGNPGLIGYYEPFLSTLSFLLQSSTSQVEFRVFGSSLAGFEASRYSNFGGVRKPPYGLATQIEIVEERLRLFIRGQLVPRYQCQTTSVYRHDDRKLEHNGERPAKVILIGHSVGAYILLELIRRRHLAAPEDQEMDFIGGILLFPTITHIAKSSAGVRFSVGGSVGRFSLN